MESYEGDILLSLLVFDYRCPGIFTDVMHITHLAIVPDAVTSTLLDWSDNQRFWGGSSREGRLQQMFNSYRNWCEGEGFGLGDRAQRRLFSSKALQPETASYAEISQKILNATAARYMIFFFAIWQHNLLSGAAMMKIGYLLQYGLVH